LTEKQIVFLCPSGATTAFVLAFRACNARAEDCRRRVEEGDDEDEDDVDAVNIKNEKKRKITRVQIIV